MPWPPLTLARLRSLLKYEPETGKFICLEARAHLRVGDVTGSLKSDGSGYWIIVIDHKLYRAHRLAWFYMTGAWPTNDIDHINGNRVDNRWENLRIATRGQNLANKKREVNRNKSGYKGVSWAAKDRRWAAFIKKEGKSKFLGYFDDKESAHEAYKFAATEMFGEFARFK